jgi:ribosomal protein L37E
MSYTILEAGKAIRCNRCARVSWNKHDVLARYCGHCHIFHDDEARKAREEIVRRQRSTDDCVIFTETRTRDELMQSYDAAPSSSEPVCRPDPTPDTSSSIDYGNSSCDSGSSGGWSD